MPAGVHPEISSSWLNAEIQDPASPRNLWAVWSTDGGAISPWFCVLVRNRASVTDNNFIFRVLQLSLSRVLWK